MFQQSRHLPVKDSQNQEVSPSRGEKDFQGGVWTGSAADGGVWREILGVLVAKPTLAALAAVG